jgi:hypothetical protein
MSASRELAKAGNTEKHMLDSTRTHKHTHTQVKMFELNTDGIPAALEFARELGKSDDAIQAFEQAADHQDGDLDLDRPLTFGQNGQITADDMDATDKVPSGRRRGRPSSRMGMQPVAESDVDGNVAGYDSVVPAHGKVMFYPLFVCFDFLSRAWLRGGVCHDLLYVCIGMSGVLQSCSSTHCAAWCSTQSM